MGGTDVTNEPDKPERPDKPAVAHRPAGATRRAALVTLVVSHDLGTALQRADQHARSATPIRKACYT